LRAIPSCPIYSEDHNRWLGGLGYGPCVVVSTLIAELASEALALLHEVFRRDG
jgi:hypothetical protein